MEEEAVNRVINVAELEITIPSEAVGRIIGKGGANINALKETVGIKSIDLRNHTANTHILKIMGTSNAMKEVQKMVEGRVLIAKRQLTNESRAVHSNTPTGSYGRIYPANKVHQTGTSDPKKGTKKWEKQRDLEREVRSDHRRKFDTDKYS